MFPHADEDRAAASFGRSHEVRQAEVRALMGLDAKGQAASASRARVGKGAMLSPGRVRVEENAFAGFPILP